MCWWINALNTNFLVMDSREILPNFHANKIQRWERRGTISFHENHRTKLYTRRYSKALATGTSFAGEAQRAKSAFGFDVGKLGKQALRQRLHTSVECWKLDLVNSLYIFPV